MVKLGVLVLSVLLLTEGTSAQVTTSARDSSKALQDFARTLSPEQRKAITNFGRPQTAQSKICPNCQDVDHSQLVFHALDTPDSESGSRHILFPASEEDRLNTINSSLWQTLNMLKGADQNYMDKYSAEEAAHAPTTLEQIQMRSEHIKSLISELSERGKSHE